MKDRTTSFELSQNMYPSAQAMIVTQSVGRGSENLAKVAILMGVEASEQGSKIEKSHGVKGEGLT